MTTATTRMGNVLNVVMAACLPIGIVLSVALPVWLVHRAGGWVAIGLAGKVAAVAAPLVILGLDGYFLFRRQKRANFDPWDEI